MSILVLLLPTGNAAANDESGGGATYGTEPTLSAAQCSSKTTWECRPRQQLLLKGHDLADVEAIDFLGGPGTRDDRRAKPRRTSFHRLTVTVPATAKSGPLRVRTASSAGQSRRALRIAKPNLNTDILDTAPTDGQFPVRGNHDMGQSKTNGFGGGRNHQGQDLFASCGTPLVAVRDTTVQRAAYQSRAGNYLVLQTSDGESYTYMHMRTRALVKTGEQVTAGQQVGEVGDTGRASGCHLHFELWTAPGWYTGGRAIDPLPQLKAWEQSATPHS